MLNRKSWATESSDAPSWQLGQGSSCSSTLATTAIADSQFPHHVQDCTYSAYCMAPFFPSWLGNGTSRRACFIGGGVPGLPIMVAGLFIVVALLEELEERKAALPARNGSNAVVGLAVQKLALGRRIAFVTAATHLAEPLRLQTLLSTAFWRQLLRSESGRGVERRGGGGVRGVQLQ